MRPLFLFASAVLIASISSIATAAAQSQSGMSYEQIRAMCRDEGQLRRNLMGNDLTRFVDECVTQGSASGTSTAAPANSYGVKIQACRREGEFQQNLSGSALQAFVAKCVGQ